MVDKANDTRHPAGSVRKRIFLGISANVAGQGINTTVQVLGMPLFLIIWGVEKYADWLLLSSLATFLSLSDVGFASAASNQMVISVGKGNNEDALCTYQSMWLMLVIAGSTICILLFATLWYTDISQLLNTTTQNIYQKRLILTFLAISAFQSITITLVCGGFRCVGEYAKAQWMVNFSRLLEFAVVLVTAFTLGSLQSVAMMTALVRLVSILVMLMLLRKSAKWLRFGARFASYKKIVELIKPASASLSLPLGAAFSNQGTLQIVGSVFGGVEVLQFVAHRTVSNLAVQLMTVFNFAVWPEASRAFGEKNLAVLRRLHTFVCRGSLCLAFLTVCCIWFAAPFVFPIWTSGNINVNRPLLASFCLVVFLRSFWHSSSIIPVSSNLHSRIALVYVVLIVAACILCSIVLDLSKRLYSAPIILAITDLTMCIIVLKQSLYLLNQSLPNFLSSLFLRRAEE